MRNFIILFLLFFTANSIFAQVQDEKYTVKLRSGSFVPEMNVKNLKQKGKTEELKPFLMDGNYYVILQFNEIPSQEKKAEMKRNGIQLFGYISGFSFIAVVPQGKLSELEDYDIRSIFGLKGQQKAANELQSSKDLPFHAMSGKDLIDIYIKYYPNIEKTDLLAGLAKQNVVILNHAENFNTIRARVKIDELGAIAQKPYISWIEPIGPKKEIINFPGKTNHRSHILEKGVLQLTGNGVNVGLWDADVEPHPDWGSRMHIKESEYQKHPHGMHTGCTIAGDGTVDNYARGMAPKANIYAWNFNTQSNGLDEYQEMEESILNDNVVVTSHSYGIPYPNGRIYSTDDANRDDLSGRYPHVTNVFAAGNDGYENDAQGNYYTTTKTVKNDLVAANLTDEDVLAPSSSRGPAYDGRMLPNIAAVGTHVYSCAYDKSYMYMTGTSMACPGVSGVVTQLYELYRNVNANTNPVSSLMRAAVCNTAQDLGNPGPDYKFGYGRINGLKAARVISERRYFIGTVANGETKEYTINVPANATGLKVMCAWTDAAGTPGAPIALVNNLDLTVDGNINPLVLDPENPTKNAEPGVDVLNNMEQVTINNPQAGAHTIQVAGTQVPEGPQQFAVVYEFVTPKVEVVYPIGGDVFNAGDKAQIRWDGETENGNFTIEYTTDGSTWTAFEGQVIDNTKKQKQSLQEAVESMKNNKVISSDDVPADARIFEWTVPNVFSETAQIRITQGGKQYLSEQFVILGTPENIIIYPCGGIADVDWDDVSGAAEYRIYKQQTDGSFAVYATPTNSEYLFTSLAFDKDNFFKLSAVSAAGIESWKTEKFIVNPLSEIVVTAATPFLEDFESNGGASEYLWLQKPYEGDLNWRTERGNSFIHLSGSSNWRDFKGWDNADFIADIFSCDINTDAVNPANGLILELDVRIVTYPLADYINGVSSDDETAQFRVMIGTDIISDVSGQSNFKARVIDFSSAEQGEFVHLKFDVSNYLPATTGNPLSLTFQAVAAVPEGVYRDAVLGSFVDIDNVKLRQLPTYDLAIRSIEKPKTGTNLSDAEEVAVKIENLGRNKVENFELEIDVDGLIFTETPDFALASGGSYVYTFDRKFDLSAPGEHVVKVKVNYLPDQEPANNTAVANVENLGGSINMPAGKTGNEFIANGLYFYDDAGPDADHSAGSPPFEGVVTFYPETPGGQVQLNFNYFHLGENLLVWGLGSHMEIYNGNSVDAPRVEINGETQFREEQDLGVVQSTAADGSLTVYFRSTNFMGFLHPAKGWKAYVSTFIVPDNDLGVVGIVEPVVSGALGKEESITLSLTNRGLKAVRNFMLAYRINDGEKVQEDVSLIINPGDTVQYTFKTKADLSEIGVKNIQAEVILENDGNIYNDSNTGFVFSDTYCLSGIVVPDKDHFTRVTFGDLIDQISGFDYEGYSQHFDQKPIVTRGKSYLLTTELEYVWAEDTCSVWIDWNNNTVFDASEEIVMKQIKKGNGGKFQTTVTVPEKLKGGEYRMRIRVAYSTQAEPEAKPCGISNYGEVEDYILKVLSEDAYVEKIVAEAQNNTSLNTDYFGTLVGNVLFFELPKEGASVFTVKTIAGTSYEMKGALGNLIAPLSRMNNIDGGESLLFSLSSGNIYKFTVTAEDGVTKKDYYIQIKAVSDGIASETAENRVFVYPNPAKDELRISNTSQFELLQIFDLTGKVVIRKNITQEELSLNVSKLEQGIYIMKLTNNEDEVITRKIEIIK